MRQRLKVLLAFVVCSAMAGCGAINGSYPRSHALVPDAKLRVLPSYSISFEDAILTAGVLYLVYQIVDPLAPAWEIRETRMPDDRVTFNLQMQAISGGGAGEARQVLLRRANALVQEKGYVGFELQRYEESIDSRIFLPRRTAEAEIKLIAKR